MSYLRVRQTNRLVPSALAGWILWLLLAGGIAPARAESRLADGNPLPLTPGLASTLSPPAPSPPAPFPLAAPDNPRYQAHVLMPRDFAAAWSPADQQAAWDAGLPVPDVVTTTNVFALAPPPSPALQPAGSLQSLVVGNWPGVYRQSFDAGFPIARFDGNCQLVTLSNHPRYRWGSGTQTTFGHTPAAALPARLIRARSSRRG